ncbi:hypothetical protein [Ottowia testudinis]|uniref:Uncharacterized protein n=1 Tax=Ottowia testudinis TaxID=2816950 RepID=A0A975CDU3_9BURK|nr:hypothetical protein [Ottowia testudinis]QTD43926.1 hypothetical protein J1M35_12315 [Ottowia testudinis]
MNACTNSSAIAARFVDLAVAAIGKLRARRRECRETGRRWWFSWADERYQNKSC